MNVGVRVIVDEIVLLSVPVIVAVVLVDCVCVADDVGVYVAVCD